MIVKRVEVIQKDKKFFEEENVEMKRKLNDLIDRDAKSNKILKELSK